MSVNLVIKSSFDRFGDDLSEVILSFLTITDKLRFECVSKQFQRLVFTKQEVLDVHVLGIIEPQFSSQLVKCLLVSSDSQFYRTIEKKAFESVLKKFKYIKTLNICDQIIIDNSIIEIIANNCQHLRHLIVDAKGFDDIDYNSVRLLGEKCGQKLNSYYFSNYYNNKCSLLYNFMPNIRDFCFNDLTIITSKANNFYSKLEKIVFGSQSFTIELLTRFVDCYSQQIKSISIAINNIDDSSAKTDVERQLFGQLTRFNNLEYLWLDLSDEDIDYRFIDIGLLSIGKTCKKLKHLDFETTLQNYSEVISLNKKFCKILSSFKALIKCKFSIEYEFEEKDNIDFNGFDNQIEIFDLLPNLEFLKLDIPLMNDKHFDSVDKHLPRLRTLDISSKNCIISDKTLHNFSKIKSLSCIELNKSNFDIRDKCEDIIYKITDNGFIDIITNCPKIRRIDVIDCSTSIITTKSIDAIIQMRINPKISYSFWIFDSFNGKIKEYLKTIANQMPNNLEIVCYDSEDALDLIP